MTRLVLPLALAALAAPAAAVPDVADSDGRVVQMAQLTIHQRIIIRVPRMQAAPPGRTPIPTPVRYKESAGPRCVAANSLAGAAIDGKLVDLVVAGGTRLRARLDGDCGPMDFYSGFYIRPAGDGLVCAGRDAIRVRSGASCRITRFRTLTVKR